MLEFAHFWIKMGLIKKNSTAHTRCSAQITFWPQLYTQFSYLYIYFQKISWDSLLDFEGCLKAGIHTFLERNGRNSENSTTHTRCSAQITFGPQLYTQLSCLYIYFQKICWDSFRRNKLYFLQNYVLKNIFYNNFSKLKNCICNSKIFFNM